MKANLCCAALAFGISSFCATSALPAHAVYPKFGYQSSQLVQKAQCFPGGGGCARWGWCWGNFIRGRWTQFKCCKQYCR
jgi:hypothetical protein